MIIGELVSFLERVKNEGVLMPSLNDDSCIVDECCDRGWIDSVIEETGPTNHLGYGKFVFHGFQLTELGEAALVAAKAGRN